MRSVCRVLSEASACWVRTRWRCVGDGVARLQVWGVQRLADGVSGACCGMRSVCWVRAGTELRARNVARLDSLGCIGFVRGSRLIAGPRHREGFLDLATGVRS